MMAGFGVQHPPESVFTFDRIGRSRWSGLRNTATMERNASCLTRGYLERILTEQLQSALLLGLPTPVARTSQGGSLQRETRHYLNVVAGIFAQRMLDADTWTSAGVTSVAIGDDRRRHYEGGADGPSYRDFSLRRLAAIGRSRSLTAGHLAVGQLCRA